MKILVFATDVLPLRGLPTSGTALRTLGLIEGLRAAGHEVVAAVPRDGLNGCLSKLDLESLSPETRRALEEFKTTAFDPTNQLDVLNRVNPDAIVCGHWPAMALRVKPSQLLIIDLAGPHILERHYQGAGEHSAAVLAKLSVLATADYFIVSGPSQRLYFLSYLMRAGVSTPEKRLLEITMPLPPLETINTEAEPPMSRKPNPEPNFIFGGVFLPWQDPVWSLETLAQILESRKKGHLTLIGGKHPNYDINDGKYTQLFERLRKNPRVSIKPLLPYEQFLEEMQKADVAVNLMRWNLERQLAVTIRSTSYLQSGLPLIYDDFADIGKLVSLYDAGWLVSPGDTPGLEAVVDEILDNPCILTTKSAQARTLAREVFSWSRALEPLLNVLESPLTSRLRETDLLIDTPENADIPIVPELSVSQYFISRLDGLSRVEFRLATHGEKVPPKIRCDLFRVDMPANGLRHRDIHSARRELVASKQMPLDMLANNDWASLDLPPVSDSSGQTFMLQLSTNERTGIAPSAWAARSNPYPCVELYHGSKLVEHTCLCIKTTAVAGGTGS